MPKVSMSQVSKSLPFDVSTTLGAQINKPNAQEAIEYVYNIAQSSSRAFVLCSYGGNANVGRYLEMFPAIPMNEAPLEVVGEFKVLAVFAATVATTATCTLGFYNITPTTPVLLHTCTFVAQKTHTETGTSSSPVFTLPAGGRLAIKVDSGSISKPHLYFTGQGG